MLRSKRRGVEDMKKLLTAILIIGVAVTVITGCGKKEEKGDLEISVSDLSEKASFYPVDFEGTEKEVYAFRHSQGKIRTA